MTAIPPPPPIQAAATPTAAVQNQAKVTPASSTPTAAASPAIPGNAPAALATPPGPLDFADLPALPSIDTLRAADNKSTTWSGDPLMEPYVRSLLLTAESRNLTTRYVPRLFTVRSSGPHTEATINQHFKLLMQIVRASTPLVRANVKYNWMVGMRQLFEFLDYARDRTDPQYDSRLYPRLLWVPIDKRVPMPSGTYLRSASENAPVRRIMVRLLDDLWKRTQQFQATNRSYRIISPEMWPQVILDGKNHKPPIEHAPDGWANEQDQHNLGSSVDLYVRSTPEPESHFWPDDAVAEVLGHLRDSAVAVNACWNAYYNNAQTARRVNETCNGELRVKFKGTVKDDSVNWHGPGAGGAKAGGLVLHIHLDVVPRVAGSDLS